MMGGATLLTPNALRQADMEAHFRLLPWDRACSEARLSGHHDVDSAPYTPEREAPFHCAGPLTVKAWSAVSVAEQGLSVASLSGLHDWREGSFREEAVGDYAASHGMTVLRTPSERENILRLEAGLLDVIVTDKANGELMAQEQRIALTHLFTLYRSPLYLTCHPSVPKALLERLQTPLDDLHHKEESL